MIEVEIRARLKDPKKFVEKLESMNAKFLGELIQSDSIYAYEKPGKPIKENGIMARIREENGKSKLEFKEICREKCAGLEIKANISNKEIAKRLLSKLGLNTLCEINKKRRLFSIEEFEISVDNVEGLGDFVEIEKIVENDDESEAAKNSCIEFLRSIVGDVKLEGPYGDLLLEAKKWR